MSHTPPQPPHQAYSPNPAPGTTPPPHAHLYSPHPPAETPSAQAPTPLYAPTVSALPQAYGEATPPPPPPKPGSFTSHAGTPAQDATGGIGGGGETRSGHDVGSAGEQAQMPVEGWVPEVLADKSKNDLQSLLAQPELLVAFLHHPAHAPAVLSRSTDALRDTLARTTALAQQTASLHQQLQQVREQTSTHLLAVRALEQSWKKKQGEMEEKLERWGPRVLHGRLVAAIGEGEREVAAVEESWLDGGGRAEEREVEGMIRRVREGRRSVALRRERRARWDEGRVGGWR